MTLLSPLDLLSVPSSEQDVIRCLVRRPRLTAVEIARFTKIPLEELEGLLSRMVGDSRLTQQLLEGQRTFDVALARESQTRRERPKTGLLDTLFK